MLLVASLSLTAGLVPLAGQAIHVDPPPAVYAEEGQGPTSWGIQADREQAGTAGFEILGEGPATASILGTGAVVFDGDRRLMFTFQFVLSPDRQKLVPLTADEDGTPAPIVRGGPAPEEIVESFAFFGPGDAMPAASSAQTCPFFCTTFFTDADAQVEFVGWMGGVSDTRLRVLSEHPATVQTRQGEARVLGDADVSTGQVNVQLQETVVEVDDDSTPAPADSRVRVGVKLIRDAPTAVHVDDRLWGTFGEANFKKACQFQTVNCLGFADVPVLCDLRVGSGGSACNSAKLSWNGPQGDGAGQERYFWIGDPAKGTWTFTIDELRDLYGPRAYDSDTGTLLLAGENPVWVNVADVRLPT